MKKYKIKKGRKLILTIVIYVLLLIFFGIVALYSWLSYFDQFAIAAIIDKNIVVKATLTEVRRAHAVGSGLAGWAIVYEYTADDGSYYRGVYTEYNVNLEEEAYAQIGKQVEIYIDGEGKRSFPMRSRPKNFTYYLVSAICFTVLAVGAVVFITVREILIAKDKKLLKQIRDNGI